MWFPHHPLVMPLTASPITVAESGEKIKNIYSRLSDFDILGTLEPCQIHFSVGAQFAKQLLAFLDDLNIKSKNEAF